PSHLRPSCRLDDPESRQGGPQEGGMIVHENGNAPMRSGSARRCGNSPRGRPSVRTDRIRPTPLRRHGFALVSVLWMTAVLAMLAAAFLTMLESDRRLAAKGRAES